MKRETALPGGSRTSRASDDTARRINLELAAFRTCPRCCELVVVDKRGLRRCPTCKERIEQGFLERHVRRICAELDEWGSS